MVWKDEDLVKHGTNLPGYLNHGGKCPNAQDKRLNFGVLDWSRLERWKSNAKGISKTNNLAKEIGSSRLSKSVKNIVPNQKAPNGLPMGARPRGKCVQFQNLQTVPEQILDRLQDNDDDDDDDLCLSGHEKLERLTTGERSSFSRRFSLNLEKITKTLGQQLSSTYKSLPVLHSSNSKNENPISRLLDPLLKIHQPNRSLISSSFVRAFLQLTMKNGIPFFKLMVATRNNILSASVKKFPSGNDDSSLTYTFYSVQDISKKSGSWTTQEIVGHMKICSSYHAEFSGLERDLYVVRASVLYGPESSMELAAVIVKNSSKENYGGIGRSRSTVVILPGGSHGGQPSPLITRWRSGGACDCGGWDIGCELGVFTNRDETVQISNPSMSDRLDLCYQGKDDNRKAFSLARLENGLYSVEYNTASISLLQAFAICVSSVTSENLTHIFQVNHLQDANNFTKSIMTGHKKVKSQTIVYAQIPPVSPIGRV